MIELGKTGFPIIHQYARPTPPGQLISVESPKLLNIGIISETNKHYSTLGYVTSDFTEYDEKCLSKRRE